MQNWRNRNSAGTIQAAIVLDVSVCDMLFTTGDTKKFNIQNFITISDGRVYFGNEGNIKWTKMI